MRFEQHLLLLRLRLRLPCSSLLSLLAILAASLLAGAWERGELGLVLDGEVAPAAYLRLVQLREAGVGGLAQGAQARAARCVAIGQRRNALPAHMAVMATSLPGRHLFWVHACFKSRLGALGTGPCCTLLLMLLVPNTWSRCKRVAMRSSTCSLLL